MPSHCYLCGRPADRPLSLKSTFTAHSSARCPLSTAMCDRCHDSMNGDEKELWYWNEGKEKWSKLWGRSLSRLYHADTLLSPLIKGTHTEGGKTFPVVSSLASRAEMRTWLLDPPEPPFTIAISESGQKHILFLAQEAYSRDRFPVQFELDSLHINRLEFTHLLQAYESLMNLGFTKTEIDSGDYRSDRLMKVMQEWLPLEESVRTFRGSPLLRLTSHVATTNSSGRSLLLE